MFREISIYDFDKVLEQDVAKAIAETELGKYTLNNFVIGQYERFYKMDHLILLPHKAVIIEDRNRLSDEYIVLSSHDEEIKGGKTDKRNSSMAGELSFLKFALAGFLREVPLELTTPKVAFFSQTINRNYAVQAVGCIRGPKCRSFQSEVTLISDEDIWFFLKNLEAELKSFDPELVEASFTARKEILEEIVGTEEDYIKFKKSQGKYSDKTLRVEELYLHKILSRG